VLALLQQIESRWENEDCLNSKILQVINDDAQLGRKLGEQEAHKDERLLIRKKVAEFIERVKPSSSSAHFSQMPNFSFIRPSHVVTSTTYREPTLKKFAGNIYQWQSWWELFDVNVHSLNIPNRIKLAELEEALDGSAAKVIEGIPRTELHYETAIELLKEAYGEDNYRVEKLIGDPMDLPPVRDQFNVKCLRNLLDGIVINVRMLSNLGRSQDSYSADLLRRLIAKMPREFAIQWNERAKDSANIDDLIEFLKLTSNEGEEPRKV
jgi:hypothetical protein